MSLNEYSFKLQTYIESLHSFPIDTNYESDYDHMGAIISDSILQAGVNYKTVVEPRINRLLDLFPEAKTTSIFFELINVIGPNYILKWNHHEKPLRLINLTGFLKENYVESHIDLKNWIQIPTNQKELLQINGIGPKTVDYLCKLVNIQTIPIDRHIRSFVNAAGISCNTYLEFQQIVQNTAALLGVTENNLDSAIWQFMTKNKAIL